MPKRRYGSGSVYLSSEGWRGSLSVLMSDGTRRRKSFRGTSKRDIERQFTAYRASVNAARPAGSTSTLAVYLDQWLAHVRDTTAHATWRGYCTRMAHIRTELGYVRLCDLGPAHVQQAISRLIAGGLAPSTAANVRGVLAIALNQAVAWKLLTSNPVDGTRPPRVVPPEPVTLTQAEVGTLLSTALAAGDDLVALWALLFVGGLRLGEALGLRWVDLEPARCLVHVRQQVQRVRGDWTYRLPKGRKARMVVVTPLVMDLLLAREQREALVFTAPRGGPWHQVSVRERLRSALLLAGLPTDVTPHGLRHSVATDAMRRGVNPRLVQAHLGHAQVSMTLQRYSHVDVAMAGAVVAGLAGLLPEGASVQQSAPKRLSLPVESAGFESEDG